MGKWHHVYVLFHNGVYRDVYLSYSEASRNKHGACCTIVKVDREDY